MKDVPPSSARASRRIELAKSYVEGLERTRDRFNRLEADHMRLNAEAIDLAAHCLMLHKALTALLDEIAANGNVAEQKLAVVDEALERAGALMQHVWTCPCGHSKYDHDELGCMYLGCKPICAVSGE